ncbi:MAG: PAS domain S-box-containing protein [Gammaproteobacteria bacterium]|jgi:PAS domain S-box-containing protein
MKLVRINFFDRLETKSLKVVLPIVLVTTALLFSVIEGLSVMKAMEELHTKKQVLVQNHSNLLSDWVWNLDRERIQLSLENLLENEIVAGAKVVDEWGNELASVGVSGDEGEFLSASAEIFFSTDSSQRPVGRTTIFVTDQLVKEQLVFQLLKGGGNALIIIFATVIGSIYANRKIITDPLTRMMTVIEKAVGSDLPEPIDWRSNDEIGVVIESFNHLMVRTKNVAREKLVLANEMTQLIDTANAPIFGVDVFGHINEWNQKAVEITGYQKNEAMHCNFVNELVADENKTAVKRVLDNALKGDETANYEFALTTRSGEKISVLLNSTTRRDASGKIIGVVGVGQDITELNKLRVEQERERKEASAQIIQSSKLATLGEMATSVAHELNQPLNVIRMAAGNSRRKISKGIAEPEYLNDKLKRIEEQTARAAAIIDHMRMFGREAKESPEPVDPRNVVMNALSLMGEQLRLAGIEIVTELPEDCSSIMGHTIQMEQVILNLFTNARDAMAGKDRKAKIILRVFESRKGVHITSEDTGGGIPEDVLPRIFEPFYTTKDMGKGTGLGLSVSYGIVRDMNGTIVAENVDDGARFTITLPTVS